MESPAPTGHSSNASDGYKSCAVLDEYLSLGAPLTRTRPEACSEAAVPDSPDDKGTADEQATPSR